jgi:ElaB/YqjD/DUF883 family membrane-anchored ribosome-binding protein
MSTTDKSLSEHALAKLAGLTAELERLESNGFDAGADLAKRALAVAAEALEFSGAETLEAAEAAVSGAADGLDEARATVRGRPIAAILLALGIGVILGRFTMSRPPEHKSWFH